MGCGGSVAREAPPPASDSGAAVGERAPVRGVNTADMATAEPPRPRNVPPPLPSSSSLNGAPPPLVVPASQRGSSSQQATGVETPVTNANTPSWRDLAGTDDEHALSLSDLRKQTELPAGWAPPGRHSGQDSATPILAPSPTASDAAVAVATLLGNAAPVIADAPGGRDSSAALSGPALEVVKADSQHTQQLPPPLPTSDTRSLATAAAPLGDAALPAVSGQRPSTAPSQSSSSGSGRQSWENATSGSIPLPRAQLPAPSIQRLTLGRRLHADGAAGGQVDQSMSHARFIAALARGAPPSGGARVPRLSHPVLGSSADASGDAVAAANAVNIAQQHAAVAALRQSRMLARKARVSRAVGGVALASDDVSPPEAVPSTAAPMSGPLRMSSSVPTLAEMRRESVAHTSQPQQLVTRSLGDMTAHMPCAAQQQNSVPKMVSFTLAELVNSAVTAPRVSNTQSAAVMDPPAAPLQTPAANPTASAPQDAHAHCADDGPVWSPSPPIASLATRQKLSALRKSLHSHHPSGSTSRSLAAPVPASAAPSRVAGDTVARVQENTEVLASHLAHAPATVTEQHDGDQDDARSVVHPEASTTAVSQHAPRTAVLSDAALCHAATEVELVFRLGALATDTDVAEATAAAGRLRALLSSITTVAKALGAEPQNVFAYLVQHLHCATAASVRNSLDRQTAVPAANGRTRMSITAAGPPPEWPDADKALGGPHVAVELGHAVAELRRLVRIKVQDNNDLALANRCVTDACGFFDSLNAYAQAKGLSPAAAMAHLRAM